MEPTQITIVIAIVTNDKKEILLGKRHEPESTHSHDKWEFVGGGIEFGETPEQAVKREALEEAGITVEIKRLLPQVFMNLWTFADGSKQHVNMIAYECKIVGGSPTPNLTENVSELKFFPLEKIKSLDTLPQVYEMAAVAVTNP